MRLSIRVGGTILLLMASVAMAQGNQTQSGSKSKPPVPSPEPQRDAAAERAIFRMLADSFYLPDELPVDADLLAATQALAKEHLAHLKASLPNLIAQQQRASGRTLGVNELQARMHAESLNEFALSWLESTGPAFDAAWLAAMLQPRFCDLPPVPGGLAEQVVMMQFVAQPHRATVLEGLRQGLQRRNTRRQGLQERPSPTVEEQVATLVGTLKSGASRPSAAMVPILADMHLKAKAPADEAKDPVWWQRCLSAQWWLRMQPLDTEEARARALSAFRYATLTLASDFKQQYAKLPFEKASDYPRQASNYGVEGLLRLQMSIDASGRVQSARIIKRTITVTGIRDNPPVAFDNLLDESALARARASQFSKPAPAKLANGIFVAEQEQQFRLGHEKNAAGE